MIVDPRRVDLSKARRRRTGRACHDLLAAARDPALRRHAGARVADRRSRSSGARRGWVDCVAGAARGAVFRQVGSDAAPLARIVRVVGPLPAGVRGIGGRPRHARAPHSRHDGARAAAGARPHSFLDARDGATSSRCAAERAVARLVAGDRAAAARGHVYLRRTRAARASRRHQRRSRCWCGRPKRVAWLRAG